MATINIDKAIRKAPTFVQHRDAAQGIVLDAHDSLSAADIRQIKAEVEDATGGKIIRRGRPDAVTAKHVRGLLVDDVQRSLVVKVGSEPGRHRPPRRRGPGRADR
ncbi:MAG: hypothetical protein ACTH0V_17700 [Microbacteriaceae bacterium]